MERRDVTITNEDFWVLPNGGIIEQRQQPRRAVTAAQAYNRVDCFIGKCLHEIVYSLAIRSREKPPAFSKVFRRSRIEPQPLDGGQGEVNVFRVRRSAGGRHDANRATELQAG